MLVLVEFAVSGGKGGGGGEGIDAYQVLNKNNLESAYNKLYVTK